MLVPRFRFRRGCGGFQWLAESHFEHEGVHRQFVALGRSLSVLKEFAAAVRWAERVGKIAQFTRECDYLCDGAGELRSDCDQFLSRARLNSMADRRSHEHARFMALDGAYRTVFTSWAGRATPYQLSQEASGKRDFENAERPGFPLDSTYGKDEPFGEAGSRAILKSCDLH
jgi:hypothetical protein